MKKMILLFAVLFNFTAHAEYLSVEFSPNEPVVFNVDVTVHTSDGELVIPAPWFKVDPRVSNRTAEPLFLTSMDMIAISAEGNIITETFKFNSAETKVEPGSSISTGPFYFGSLPKSSWQAYQINVIIYGSKAELDKPEVLVTTSFNTME